LEVLKEFVVKKKPMIIILSGALALSLIGFYAFRANQKSNQRQVPNLIGLSKAEAQRQIEDQDLQLDTVASIFNDKVTRGNVISQTPVAGETITKGSWVTLTISKGPNVKKHLLGGTFFVQGSSSSCDGGVAGHTYLHKDASVRIEGSAGFVTTTQVWNAWNGNPSCTYAFMVENVPDNQDRYTFFAGGKKLATLSRSEIESNDWDTGQIIIK